MQGNVTSEDDPIAPETNNRRGFDRREFRTTGTAYLLADEPHAPGMAIRVWTRDVSISGAKVSSNEEIVPAQFYLRLLLPQLSDQLLECEIMNRSEFARVGINGKERREFLYGIRFVGVMQDSQLTPQIRALLDIVPTPVQSRPT